MNKCNKGVGSNVKDPRTEAYISKALSQEEMPKDKDEALSQFEEAFNMSDASKTQIPGTIGNDFISASDAIRRSSVKMSTTEDGLVLKDTQMTTPLDNFSRGNRDTRQIHNMLSENFILHRINKDGSITAFLEIENGKYKVIKGLRTFEDVAREIGIPNPYEER